MLLLSIWITGATRTGKTTRLVEEFRQWVERQLKTKKEFVSPASPLSELAPAILVFAANDDNKRELADKLSTSIQGSYPVIAKTPLGFISDEVRLFWPILFEQLHLKAQFPLRLRPETEQELATKLWRAELNEEDVQRFGGESRFVRRTLDLLQLAGAAGIPAEDIPAILEQGLPEEGLEASREEGIKDTAQRMGKLLLNWRQWCLNRGLLSYGIIYALYWRYLLPNPSYQQHLTRRYRAIFADNLDDYPAIAKDLFKFLLDQGAFAVFTYNSDGQVRLGLNADPNYLAGLASRCQVEELAHTSGLAAELGDKAIQLVTDPSFITSLPDSVQSIQTISRAELLRKTAEIIIKAVGKGEVKPAEIAIIAPGLDEIARYSLIEIFSHKGIPIEPLNEQRPLISSPIIRALLNLLGLIYPGLGRLVYRDAVAEMLVVLSQKPKEGEETKERHLIPEIDPVRGGLLADYCYHLDPEYPHLLSVEKFARWDRLGHRATTAYKEILQWIEKTKSLLGEQKFASPIVVLDQAIKHFFPNTTNLPYDQLAALRELMETAQHYWEVDGRLRQNEPVSLSQTAAIAQFIQLLRRGTITANPRPVRYLGIKEKGNLKPMVIRGLPYTKPQEIPPCVKPVPIMLMIPAPFPNVPMLSS
ncbi:MAG: recombinase family protein, partial [Moorea sp. SIO2B7]|nr:recombinase family protein [Moorena sp. SIO2B7]